MSDLLGLVIFFGITYAATYPMSIISWTWKGPNTCLELIFRMFLKVHIWRVWEGHKIWKTSNLILTLLSKIKWWEFFFKVVAFSKHLSFLSVDGAIKFFNILTVFELTKVIMSRKLCILVPCCTHSSFTPFVYWMLEFILWIDIKYASCQDDDICHGFYFTKRICVIATSTWL